MSASGLVEQPAARRIAWLEFLRQDPRRLISAIVGVVLAVLMLPPLWILIQDSVTSTTNAIGDVTGWTFEHFRKLVTDQDALRSIWNTLVFAARQRLVLSLISGGVLAWLVERTNAPLKISASFSPPSSLWMGTSLYPACDRLAVPAGQDRAIERFLPHAVRPRRTICST